MVPLPIRDQLKALRAFVTLSQQPANFDAIYDLDEVLRLTPLSQISIAYLKTQPGVAELIQERYLAPTPNLDLLLGYPPESLGYQYAAHLKANQFDPEFYRPRAVTNDINYISLRRSQTHDIHHVITGFGTDLGGELGLQSFQLAQLRSPLALGIITAGLIYRFTDPRALNDLVTQIIRGWTLGLQAKPLMAQKWEVQWEKPLYQWQMELDIVPVVPNTTPWAIAA